MASAREARDWAAQGGLRGIGDSLYTPFTGADGDDIDWDAYRTLVRYCAGDLRHDMLWLTSGIGEWWSLTIDERKRLLEVAVEEARAVNANVVIQACTAADSAKAEQVVVSDAAMACLDLDGVRKGRRRRLRGEGTPSDMRIAPISRA